VTGRSQPIATKSSPKNASIRFADGLRTYDWQGRDLISVTSGRQAVGQPYGLVRWMLGQVAGRAMDNNLTLSDKMRDLDLIEDPETSVLERVKIMKWLIDGATEVRDVAAARGSAIHSHVELDTDISEVPEDLRGAVASLREGMARFGITPLLRERQVFNLTLGYAGSFDLIGVKDDKITMVDVKTGSGVYIDHALQIAGYCLGEFIGENDVIDGPATDLLHSVERAGILHVTTAGTEWVEVPLTPQLGDAFRAQIGLANFYVNHPTIGSLPAPAGALTA
jgi:hypothetical protein